MIRRESVQSILKYYLPQIDDKTLTSLSERVEQEMTACGKEAIRKIVFDFDRSAGGSTIDIKA